MVERSVLVLLPNRPLRGGARPSFRKWCFSFLAAIRSCLSRLLTYFVMDFAVFSDGIFSLAIPVGIAR